MLSWGQVLPEAKSQQSSLATSWQGPSVKNAQGVQEAMARPADPVVVAEVLPVPLPVPLPVLALPDSDPVPLRTVFPASPEGVA